MKANKPSDYDRKFAEFIRLCEESKANGIGNVIIAKPWVLGDNYDEMVESLSRLADAGLTLNICSC
jgi:hypothetical protein